MELVENGRRGVVVVSVALAGAWLGLILTAVLVLGPVLGLLVGVWGVSWLGAAFFAATTALRAAVRRLRPLEGASMPAHARA